MAKYQRLNFLLCVYAQPSKSQRNRRWRAAKDAQTKLPHMLCSGIIDHRKWVHMRSTVKKGLNETAGIAEATSSEDEEEAEQEEGEEEGDTGFSILTAKARADYRRDCSGAKWAKIRLCQQEAKQRWTTPATASGSMPRVHKQGDDCTFDLDSRNHPLGKDSRIT